MFQFTQLCIKQEISDDLGFCVLNLQIVEKKIKITRPRN